jgi:uncharacterized protein (TIGR03382 family)
MRTRAVIVLLLLSPAPAFALDQSVHRQISHDGCIAAGIPQDFCERVGTEAYNVDSYEWSHPEAHSQIGEGAIGTACTAANAALERERELGSDIRTSLETLSGSPSEDLRIHIATQLGRALHTIQDDCAHHGMPNAQHAFWSLTDSCTGSKTSPDAQPEAASCARSETAAIFAAFTQEMATAGVSAASLDDVSEGWTHWPARGDVCAFLREASTWDGVDRRWNNAIAVPWLRDQLTNAITSDDSSVGDTCSSDVEIVQYHPDAPVDVSTPPAWCFKVSALCAGTGGKEDDGQEVPPPWEDGSTDAESSGCSAGSQNAPVGWLAVALIGLVGVARRRRVR